jgi:hypothetical protein
VWQPAKTKGTCLTAGPLIFSVLGLFLVGPE